MPEVWGATGCKLLQGTRPRKPTWLHPLRPPHQFSMSLILWPIPTHLSFGSSHSSQRFVLQWTPSSPPSNLLSSNGERQPRPCLETPASLFVRQPDSTLRSQTCGPGASICATQPELASRAKSSRVLAQPRPDHHSRPITLWLGSSPLYQYPELRLIVPVLPTRQKLGLVILHRVFCALSIHAPVAAAHRRSFCCAAARSVHAFSKIHFGLPRRYRWGCDRVCRRRPPHCFLRLSFRHPRQTPTTRPP